MRRSTPWIIGLAFITLTLPAAVASASTARHQLDAVLPEIRFDGVSLADAVDFLRDVSGANINVNWKALEGRGVSRDLTVNVRLRSIAMRKALDLLLSEAGGGGKIGYTVDQNVIEITTQEIIDSQMYTRVYPVQDLIMEIPDFDNAPDFSLQSTSNNPGQNGQAGAGSASTSPFASGATADKSEKSKSKIERANDLVELIRTLIQPDIWIENGGKAAIRYFNGNLVVTAPRSVQEAIGGPFD